MHVNREILAKFALACTISTFFGMSANACTKASSEQVQEILNEGVRIRTSISFRTAPDSTVYDAWRAQTESYEEDMSIPCLERASVLLERRVDVPLMNALFAHVLAHEQSADETKTAVLGHAFVRSEKTFMLAWRGSSSETKAEVARTVETYLKKNEEGLSQKQFKRLWRRYERLKAS